MANNERVVEREVMETPAENRVNQIVYFVVSIIEIILLFRLILRMFGATTANNFVRFIYDISAPLVAPFFGIFQTELNLEVGQLEPETVVAMLVYLALGYIIVALINIVRGQSA